VSALPMFAMAQPRHCHFQMYGDKEGTVMKLVAQELFTYEFVELLEALRRDMRRQFDLADTNTPLADWHRTNARLVLRILEALNPRPSTRTPCGHSNFSSAFSDMGRETELIS
jgi:hypothetical protein